MSDFRNGKMESQRDLAEHTYYDDHVNTGESYVLTELSGSKKSIGIKDEDNNVVTDDGMTLKQNANAMDNSQSSTDESCISSCNSLSVRILSGATLTNFLSAMQWQAYGLYYIKITEYFGISKAAGGWPGSMCVATSCLSGLFLTPAMAKLNSRWTSAISGLFMFVGMLASSLSPNILTLSLSYGLITGFGMGGSMLCSVIEIQQTFEKNRPLAQGVAYLGFSLSNVISPIMLATIIGTFGWRGAMLIHSALVLHTTPFSFLYRRTCEIIKKTQQVSSKEEQCPDTKKPPKCCACCYLSSSKCCLLRILKDMFDFSLLKNPIVLLYSIASLIHRSCSVVFLMNVPSRAVSVGMTFAEGAYLVSGYSCGNFSGRFLITFLSNLSCINLTLLLALCTSCAGVIGCVMSVWDSFYVSIAFCFGLGIFQGSSNTLLPSVLSELCGTGNIARLQAVTNSFGALPILLMPPFSGYLYTVTQSYVIPYIVFGLIELSASFIFCILYPLNKHRKYATKNQA